MDLLMNGLLTAATLFAGGYCWVLARRVRDLKSLDSGLGASIVTLTRQVELARTTLDEARSASKDSRYELTQLIARADVAAGQLRMLLAAVREPGPARTPAPPPVEPLPVAVRPAPEPQPVRQEPVATPPVLSEPMPAPQTALPEPVVAPPPVAPQPAPAPQAVAPAPMPVPAIEPEPRPEPQAVAPAPLPRVIHPEPPPVAQLRPVPEPEAAPEPPPPVPHLAEVPKPRALVPLENPLRRAKPIGPGIPAVREDEILEALSALAGGSR